MYFSSLTTAFFFESLSLMFLFKYNKPNKKQINEKKQFKLFTCFKILFSPKPNLLDWKAKVCIKIERRLKDNDNDISSNQNKIFFNCKNKTWLLQYIPWVMKLVMFKFNYYILWLIIAWLVKCIVLKANLQNVPCNGLSHTESFVKWHI